MTAKIRVGIRTQQEKLRRLAVVFAVPLRLKIVTELYQREMSPKQFYEEFGGGSISRVTQNFKRLAEASALRYIHSEGPGGKRHGGVEHFYRATELAFWDRETWAMLPYSIRVAFSWHSFVVIAQMLRETMEAQVSEARQDRNLTCTRIVLDQQGWENVVEAVGNEFAEQYDEQEDATRRAAHSGERLIRAGSILMAFASPSHEGMRIGPLLAPGREALIPFYVRMSKVIDDEICMAIVDEANRGETSVPHFHAEYGSKFGVDSEAVGRRFKKAVEMCVLREVGRKSGGKRRGGTEKFYRATWPAPIDSENTPWANAPAQLRKSAGWETIEQLCELIKEAIVAGTFDDRPDRCMAWSILSLDQAGWEKIAASQEELRAFISQEEKRAKARLKDSGEEPILVTVSLGTFEPTPESLREP